MLILPPQASASPPPRSFSVTSRRWRGSQVSPAVSRSTRPAVPSERAAEQPGPAGTSQQPHATSQTAAVPPQPSAAPQQLRAAAPPGPQLAPSSDSRAPRAVTRPLIPGELRSAGARGGCAQCGGTGAIAGPHGPVPCTACQPWRRRPEPQAGSAAAVQPPVSGLGADNLEPPSALVKRLRAPSPPAQPHGAVAAGPELAGAPKSDLWEPPAAAISAAAAAGAPEAPAPPLAALAAELARQPQPQAQQGMTEEKREAIRLGALRRGKQSLEHRRNIARAMREAHAKDPSLRHAAKGAKKSCSLCGAEGHTRRSCPQRKQEGDAAEAAAVAAAAAEGPSGQEEQQKRRRGPSRLSEDQRRRLREALRQTHLRNPELRFVGKGKQKTCAYCGGKGHTRRSCPQRKADEAGVDVAEVLAAAAGPKPRRQPTCGHCGQVGHIKRWCPELRDTPVVAAAAVAADGPVLVEQHHAAAEELPAAANEVPAGVPPLLLPGAKQGAEPSGVPQGAAAAARLSGDGEEQVQPVAVQPAVEAAGGLAEPLAPPQPSPAQARRVAAGAALASAEPAAAAAAAMQPPNAASAMPAAAASVASSISDAAAAAEPSGAAGAAAEPLAGPSSVADAADAAAGPGAETAGRGAAASSEEADGARRGAVNAEGEGAGDLREAAAAGAAPPSLAATPSSLPSQVSAGALQQLPQPPPPQPLQPAQQASAGEPLPPPLSPTTSSTPPAASNPLPPPVRQPQAADGGGGGKAAGRPPAPAPAPRQAAFEREGGPAAGPRASYDDARLATRELGSGMLLDPDGGLVFPLPSRQADCIRQASQAVLRAWEDGVRWQCLELPLPLNNAPAEGGWPGGIRQQYRVALPVLEGLLLRLKQYEGLQGRITAEWLDKADCVGAWQSEKLAAVLFPTADTLPAVRRIENALSGQRLMLVVNPQWQVEGQIISDFGFGQARRRAEQFIRIFEDVYCLRRARVRGEEVRILKCYPGTWQVYYVPGGGNSKEPPLLLACEESKPTYQRLEELMQPIFARKSNWLQQWLGWGEAAAQDPAFDPAGWWPEEAPRPVAGAGEAEAPAGAAAPALGAAGSRDIITGEPLDEEGEVVRREELEGLGEEYQGVPIPGQAEGAPRARDYRLQPVQQMARWVFGEQGPAAPSKKGK